MKPHLLMLPLIALSLTITPEESYAKPIKKASYRTSKPSSIQGTSMRKAAYRSPISLTSKQIRRQKSYGVAARYGAPGIGEFTPGVEAYKLINSKLQIGGMIHLLNKDYASELGEVRDEYGTSKADRAQVTGQILWANARYFVGNSFFLGAGLGYRHYDVDLQMSQSYFDVTSLEFSTEVKADSYMAMANLGNSWSFGNGLFVGAEWFGWAQPLASSYTIVHKDNLGDEGLTNDIKELEESFAESLSSSGSLYMNLAVGYQF